MQGWLLTVELDGSSLVESCNLVPTLGVDVDSKVWDTVARVREAVLEVTGEALESTDVYTWTQLLDIYSERRPRRSTNEPYPPKVSTNASHTRGLPKSSKNSSHTTE